jgi:acyl-CoA thioester hydrolase
MGNPAASTFTVDGRYRDIDRMGHANNAVYAMCLETARAALFVEHPGLVLTDAPTVLASCRSTTTRQPLLALVKNYL